MRRHAEAKVGLSGHFSGWREFKSEVLQEYVLELSVFNIFISDLEVGVHSGISKLLLLF